MVMSEKRVRDVKNRESIKNGPVGKKLKDVQKQESGRNGKEKTDDMQGLSKGRIYWELFRQIFILSACTFGGGFVIIGMIRKVFVEKLHWISEEEILDLTVIAQSTPGPLGVNMAVITGYRIQGVSGALVCALAASLPPIIIISVISVFYNQFKDNRIIALLLQVMRAGVAAVLVDVVIDLAANVLKTKNALWILLMVASFVALVWFKVSIVWLILICGAVGLVYSLRTGKEARK